jgi:hypothetical protein
VMTVHLRHTDFDQLFADAAGCWLHLQESCAYCHSPPTVISPERDEESVYVGVWGGGRGVVCTYVCACLCVCVCVYVCVYDDM